MRESYDIISEANQISEIMVGSSGTYCQSNDSIDTLPTGDAIFGQKENHEVV